MRATRLVAALVATVSVATLTGGCAAFSNQAPSHTGPPRVVAAFYPLQYVAERIVGDHAEVVDLTRPGAEPHDLELSVAQTADVASADLVVYEHGLQAAVDDAVALNASGETVDAAAVAGLEPVGHDGHDDSGQVPALGASPEDGDLDPHFWQDPLKLERVAAAVAAAMVRLDPAHADDYRAHLSSVDADLTALDREYAAGLARCERHTIVVSHDAFGYLSRYGLDVEPIVGLSPDAEPTPADLARLQALIRTDGITTVFGERLVSPAIARTLAHDLGVRSAVLDPIEGLSDQTADQDYLSLMRENLRALQAADGCTR